MSTADRSGDLEVDSRGTVMWFGAPAPAVAEVFVDVARGIRVTVDVADPSTPLNWAITADADAGLLAAAVGDPDLERTVAQARSGSTVHSGPYRFVSVWARQALTASVARWSTAALHNGALLLDRAAAAEGIGNRSSASRLVALASPSFTALGQRCIDGDLGGGAATELAALTSSAARAVSDTVWGSEVAELSRELDRVTTFDDSDLFDWLAQFEYEENGQLAGHLGETDTEAGLTTERAAVDPHLVPSRILAWSGSRTPELTIELRDDDSAVEMSVLLAGDVDPFCAEASRFLGYAADRATGEVLVVTRLTVRDRTLVGELSIAAADRNNAVYGVFYADRKPADVRATELGRTLVEVDRLMLESWNFHRAALAVQSSVDVHDGDRVDVATESSNMLFGSARESASSARSILDDIIARGQYANSELEDALQERLTAISKYVATLRTKPAAPDGTHPLLAEMLRAEPWDEL
ncbi:hypothetical protein [Rhodococcus sp. KRD162]|uniref:hypothetical protein n=1 Tax=Rhodococcus sp. KRD162 TaxID=2729725 RepID=UPI0019CFB7B3|nr:hypothetical protein [Rhodococcus sp. KRD162]